jgi:hypothetical protein
MPQWGCGVGRRWRDMRRWDGVFGWALSTERPVRDAMQSVRSIPRRLGRLSSRRQFDS